MCIKDRPYFYKEVPARTLLVNEAKKFRLTKTKFSSRRQKISSYITNFSFDSSPNLRNIRRHQNNRYAKISPLFRLKRRFATFWSKFANFAVICEVRLTPRICTALYSLSAVLHTACSGTTAMTKKYRHIDIRIDEVSSNYFLEYQLHSFKVLLSKSTFAKIESSITYFWLFAKY